MKKNKYKMNQIVYFVNGYQIIKGVIDEYILHYTQTKTIIKYVIRPYGLDEYVTIDEEKISINLEELKEEMLKNLKQNYTLEKIKEVYNTQFNKLNIQEQKAISEYYEKYQEIESAIENKTDEYFNDKEEKYQLTKGEK